MEKVCLFIFGVLILGAAKAQEYNLVQLGHAKAAVNQPVIQVAANFEQFYYLLGDSTVLFSGENCSTDKEFFESFENVKQISAGIVLTSDNVGHLKFSNQEVLDVPNILKGYKDYGNRFLVMKEDSSFLYINEDGSEDTLTDNVKDILVTSGIPTLIFDDNTFKFESNQFPQWLLFNDIPEQINKNVKSVALANASAGRLMVLRKDSTVVVFEEDFLNGAQVKDDLGFRNIVAIQGGGDGFVLLDADGKCYTYGDLYLYNPERITLLKNVKSISLSDASFLALDSSGKVLTISDKHIYDFTPDLSSVIDLYAGENYTLGINSDSSVFAFGGKNEFGELDVPSDLLNAKDLAIVGNQSIAIQNNGTAAVWGELDINKYPYLDEFKSLDGIKTIEVYNQEIGVLLANGKVWSSTSGMLNINSVKNFDISEKYLVAQNENGEVLLWDFTTQTLTQLDQWQNIIDVAIAKDYSDEEVIYAVQAGGNLKSWINGVYGERLKWNNVVSIDGHNGLIALLADGTIKTLEILAVATKYQLKMILLKY